MIWQWIGVLFRSIGRFLVPIPPDLRVSRIDPNSPCPACGNQSGKLEFNYVDFPEQAQVKVPMVRHTCLVCSFSWFSKAISTPKYPAV